MDHDEEPLYNIGAVSRMTGIAEATLRAWERRYHFPHPTRSSGKHRLYSQHEVQRLQWVKARVGEGMQPSRAIHALATTAPTAPAADSRPQPPPEGASELTVPGYQRRLLRALIAYEGQEAQQILDEALRHYSVETVTLEMISPTLFAIGEAWSVGEIDVAIEHFASDILRHRLRSWMQPAPPLAEIGPVGLACAPGELHEGSILILGVLLARLHWPILYLGQSLPLADLAPLIERAHPSIIVFVAMSEAPARTLADWPEWMPEAAPQPLIAYGGRAFEQNAQLASVVPGILLGNTLHEGIATLNRLLADLRQDAG